MRVRTERKTVQIIVFAALLMIVIIVATGCCKENSRLAGIAKEQMANKYGETFTVIDIVDHGSYFTAWMRPNHNIRMGVIKGHFNTQEAPFNDNYIARKLCYKLTQKANESMTGYDGAYYIYTESHEQYAEEENKDIGIREYLKKHPGDSFETVVFLEENCESKTSLDKRINDIVNTYEANAYPNSITFFTAKKRIIRRIQQELNRFGELDSTKMKELLCNANTVTQKTFADGDNSAF